MNPRVAITGAAGITPLGDSWQQTRSGLGAMKNCVRRMESWDDVDGLNTRLAAPIVDIDLSTRYGGNGVRSMGRVAQLAVHATHLALSEAGLLDDPTLSDGSTGVAYGSCTGSTEEIVAMGDASDLTRMQPVQYLRLMSHTAAMNICRHFDIRGRVVPTPSACTAGSQSIGFAYEAIRAGRQTIMVAGGAEQLCVSEAAVFDVLYATSTRNDEPNATPCPFDTKRDGLVVGEGAGTLILEDMDHAKARGANILAELVGFGTNADGAHVTRPNQSTMQKALESALADADIDGQQIGYVCAHGTATEHGDIAETNATAEALGKKVPISSLKSYLGHTLGACGALEAWMTLNMLNDDWYAPTLNLENLDERCGDLDYLRGAPRKLENEFVMSNNFAFGGINTSLIFQRV
ncbi:MAG: beta-ketoacyl-ACP synthase [Gammaproteobacteria bacterium]